MQGAKKICFISSRSGFLNEDGGFWMDWANGRLISHLLFSYPSMSVAFFASPVFRSSYDLKILPEKTYGFPFPFSYGGGLINTIRLIRIVRKIQRDHDLLIIQLPFIGFLSLLFVTKPVVYHLCANVLTAAANPVKYKGLKKLFSVRFAKLMHSVYRTIFRKSNVRLITNGKELGMLYQDFDPRIVISSSIEHDELLLKKDFASTEAGPIRLLFVGRPSLEKGFDTLVNALTTLPNNFTLTAVGFHLEDFERMLPELFLRSVNVHNRILFKGYLGWQDGLKEILREHDIIVVPSRSEGTPRVILEAMSQRCAVIASGIGGIPSIVEDGVNGLLINPASVKDVQEKIIFLWQDRKLRQKLVLSGIEKAKQHTIEEFSQHFINEIETLKNV